MLEVLLDCIIDVLKMLPILLVVYAIIEIVQLKLPAKNFADSKASMFGPILGALFGCIPQCGFSAAASTLYNSRLITFGTLAAVFIATSDEAIPVLLTHNDRIFDVFLLIVVKLVVAIIVGYIIYALTKFRKRFLKKAKSVDVKNYNNELDGEHIHDCHHSCHCEGGAKVVIKNTIVHTVKISLFVLVILIIFSELFYLAGEENISKILLSGTVFQPFLTSLIGLVPGCATSVLLTELYAQGLLSFGSVIAGLSTGSGFGYVILFQNKANFKKNIMIIVTMYLAGAIVGTVMNLISMLFC